mmetsp:Transcript_160850/g.516253  ORF Transcript_160850/g.516253 Transcript_160850/m.516253 type:complete len:275 (+) Transcript_160850:57-881(+)
MGMQSIWRCIPIYNSAAGSRLALEHRDNVATYGPLLADRIHLLVRPGLDVHAARRAAEERGDVLDHAQLVVEGLAWLGLGMVLHDHPRGLRDQRHVEVPDAVAPGVHLLPGLVHEDVRGRALPAGVRVREELADVRQRQGAEDRIDDRVVGDVAVGVRHDAQLEVLEDDAADDNRAADLRIAPRRHAVDVEAVADAQGRLRRPIRGVVVSVRRRARHPGCSGRRRRGLTTSPSRGLDLRAEATGGEQQNATDGKSSQRHGSVGDGGGGRALQNT